MWRGHLSFCFHRQTILLDLKHMYTIKILRTVCVLNCLVLYLVIVIFILLYPCHMWQQLLFTLCLNLSCIPVFDLVLTLILDCGLNLLLTLLHMNPHTSSTSRPLQYSNITFQLNDIICLSIFCTTYPRELGAQGRGHPGQGTLTHTYTQSNLPLRKDIIKQLRPWAWGVLLKDPAMVDWWCKHVNSWPSWVESPTTTLFPTCMKIKYTEIFSTIQKAKERTWCQNFGQGFLNFILFYFFLSRFKWPKYIVSKQKHVIFTFKMQVSQRNKNILSINCSTKLYTALH